MNIKFEESDKLKLLSFLSYSDENFVNLTLEDYYFKHKVSCELVLRKIHFVRQKKYSEEEYKIFANFLKSIYLISKDVRYFNEYLWCFKSKVYIKDKEVIDFFYSNLNKSGNHFHDFNIKGNVNMNMNINTLDYLVEDKKQHSEKLKIGLLGVPFYFYRLIKHKDNLNITSGVAILKHHNRILELVFNNFLFIMISKLFTNNKIKWSFIKKNETDSISTIITNQNWDIAFHKLGFILKENIINSVRGGIINEHWGYLPYIRGKSTIEYSILLNIPIVCTHHFVIRKIDCGNIIAKYHIPIAQFTNINQIKNHIRKTLSTRIFQTLKGFKQENVLKNKEEDGKTFYLMHPFLLEYINLKILKNNS